MKMDEHTLISLFEQALDLPEEERETFIARVCGNDRASMAKLRFMLAADATDRGILDFSVQQVAAKIGLFTGSIEDTDETGRRIGNYRLVERLGHGGMGVVYRAERDDGMFSQVVALKLIRKSRLRANAKARFLRERGILAEMKHPHIAHIVDGGLVDDGEPWFAMEYVDGDPMLAWCDAKYLDVATRIRLFLPICEAVGFAHHHLVVHCDIKPSNVLIDSNGEPKLLDFGVAKLLGADGVNDASIDQEPAMAQRYAAPEQIRGGAITVATDVYALGLLLYELLCGRPVFEVHSPNKPDALREVFDFAVPPMASAIACDAAAEIAARRRTSLAALKRTLSGDLQHILTLSLHEEPEQRYASADALAADLKSYLDRRPIASRSNAWTYRLRKFLLRNKISAALVSVIVLITIAGLFVASWQYQRTRQEVQATEAVSRLFTSTLGNAVLSGLGNTPFSSKALLVEFHPKLSHFGREFPSKFEPPPTTLRSPSERELRSDRRGPTERHPTLAPA